MDTLRVSQTVKFGAENQAVGKSLRHDRAKCLNRPVSGALSETRGSSSIYPSIGRASEHLSEQPGSLACARNFRCS